MAGIIKSTAVSDPVGPNEYLASTKNTAYRSFMFAADTLPTETVDGTSVKGVLRRGEVLARITSGPNTDKVGVFQAGATDGRQTAANIIGVNDTMLFWELDYMDKEVSALYHGTIRQAWCTERAADGTRSTLSDTTRDAMRGTAGLDLLAL